jgi:chromosome segregation ATPase
MTVPGKGGRPRKWRSDADRVRAFRARHRGEEEPATFEEALVDGDDLARAVEHSRQLQADLVAALASLSESNAALQTERRRHQSTLRRLDRARAELDGLRTAGARREEELELLREGFAELGPRTQPSGHGSP